MMEMKYFLTVCLYAFPLLPPIVCYMAVRSRRASERGWTRFASCSQRMCLSVLPAWNGALASQQARGKGEMR